MDEGTRAQEATKQVTVDVAMLTRQTKTITVTVPIGADDDDIREIAWLQVDEATEEWVDDMDWCEEGTHHIHKPGE